MYLRATKRKNKDGSTVTYYQLAHNERHPRTKKPIARIIHRFGRADKVERAELIRLCQSIARVCGLEIHDPLEGGRGESLLRDKVGYPEDIKLIQTVTLGTIAVIEEIWERVGIGKVLRDIGSRKKQSKVAYERAVFAMTANRLCEPESKLGVWDRWLSKVYLPSCKGLKLDHMYEAMDFLHDHIDKVEESIFLKTANLFNLDVDLIFYDTTTASFSIDYEDGDSEEEAEEVLRKRGKSKEGSWTPQVVVALAVTREGLPVRSWVFPGNTADVTTIQQIKRDLRGWNLGRALFVADAGMNSEENRAELSRACGKYILATRMASVSEIKRKVLSKRGRYQVIKDNLLAKEVIVGEGERRKRYILCYNPKEARRQKHHREMIIAQLERELAGHRDKKATAQWAIELLASKRYKRYLKITTGDNISIDRASVREARKYDGKWVIETNDDTISVEDAAKGYKGLMVIERCFRSLKRTQIKITPMYHWVSRRIETHVKICVLALLIERAAELACSKPWSQIREVLEKLQVSEFHTPEHVFFKLNEVDNQVREVFNKLGIPLPASVLGISALPVSASEQ